MVCTCIAKSCFIGKSVESKSDYNQLNKKKVASKNSQMGSRKSLNINGIDAGSIPPLYKAVGFNDLQEAHILLESGANPNVIYKDDCLLEVAVSKRSKEMVSLLLFYGAKIFFQEDGRSKVLDAVCSKKDAVSKEIYALLVSHLSPEEAARLDLEWQKDINEVKNRSTPLLKAVMKNDLVRAKELLLLGADPNIARGDSTPISWAVHNRRDGFLITFLWSRGNI